MFQSDLHRTVSATTAVVPCSLFSLALNKQIPPRSLLEGPSLPLPPSLPSSLPPSLPPSTKSHFPHPFLAALSRRRSGVCYFFSEEFSIFLPLTVLYLMAMRSMANRLKDASDAFRIRNEIGYICLATAITSGGVGRRQKSNVLHLLWQAARTAFYRYLDSKKRTASESKIDSKSAEKKRAGASGSYNIFDCCGFPCKWLSPFEECSGVVNVDARAAHS